MLVGGLTYYFLTHNQSNITKPTPAPTAPPSETPSPTSPTPTAPPSGTPTAPPSGTPTPTAPANVDCVVAYNDWSVCDGLTGTKKREGTIVQQPIGSGRPCPSSLTQTVMCCPEGANLTAPKLNFVLPGPSAEYSYGVIVFYEFNASQANMRRTIFLRGISNSGLTYQTTDLIQDDVQSVNLPAANVIIPAMAGSELATALNLSSQPQIFNVTVALVCGDNVTLESNAMQLTLALPS